MTTACEEDLAEGRKPWAMRHRDRERATVGSPHQEVGSQRRAVCPCPSGTARRERGLCQSVYQSHRSKKTWPICGPSATLAARSTKQSVHPTRRYGAVI